MVTMILFNTICIIALVLIVWWFWIAKSHDEMQASTAPVKIIVAAGVYSPSIIRAVINKPLKLRFIRKDATPCSEKVIFEDFDLSADLPIDQPYDMSFTPTESGEFEFTCQMGMYRGKLIVEPQ